MMKHVMSSINAPRAQISLCSKLVYFIQVLGEDNITNSLLAVIRKSVQCTPYGAPRQSGL